MKKLPFGKLSDVQDKAAKLFNIVNAARAGAGLRKDLPLAYCLMLDPNAPLGPKAWFAAKFAFMAIDAPLPLVGQIDVYVAIQASAALIAGCEKVNKPLVDEHRAALAAKTSIFDRHVALGVDTGKMFGGAVASAAVPVRDGVKRVAVPVVDGVNKHVAAPVAGVVHRGIDRIRGIG